MSALFYFVLLSTIMTKKEVKKSKKRSFSTNIA